LKTVDLVAEPILITSARRGGPRFRLVPIHPTLLKSLKTWKLKDKDKKAFYAAKNRAGINRRLRIYDFRHSFTTTVLGQEADLKSRAKIQGHSRPDTTMKHYQQTNLKLHRKTINKLPELKLPE
jgi:integrase